MSSSGNERVPSRWPRLVVGFAGTLSAVLGLAGVLSWWWHTAGVDSASGSESTVSMQVNTAAGLVLVGGGAVAMAFRRRGWAGVYGGGALLLAFLPFLQDVAGFEAPGATEAARATDRMPPNAALSLALAAAAVLVLSIDPPRKAFSSLVSSVFAAMTVALAGVALAGYAMNLKSMHTWGTHAPMTGQTTAGLLLAGTGLFLYASSDTVGRQTRLPLWFPVPVAIGGLTATVCVWRALTESKSGIVDWIRSLLQEKNFVDEYVPELALLAGLAIVLLLTLAIHLGQKVSFRTAERRRAMGELRKTRDELERRVEERTTEIASVNEELQEEIRSRAKLEKALRERADLLVDADRRKDEFLAMLGHELRNPLATLSLGLETMDRMGPEDPAFAETCRVMSQRLRQITRLVDDLLDVSRISSGRITLRRRKLDLGRVVSRAVENLRPLACEHELSVSVPRDPVTVDGDEARLEQVVSNLISNAIKYTEKSGGIGVTAERDDGQAVLRVRDTGIGISSEALPRIFDSFDLAVDRAGGGLGLGLTLVRRLVNLHGGTVEAFSGGAGMGSEFVVRLPLVAAAEVEAPARVRKARGASPRRVLIVDDRADLLVMLKRLLEAWGHEVTVASDGLAALEVAAETTPEVALIDIGLPGMSGYDLACRLRERTSRKTLLVAVTGYGQPDHRRRVRQAGFDHHLVKPVDLDALRDILENSIG